MQDNYVYMFLVMYTCIDNYVYIQVIYVYMQDDKVYMQDN